jgi:hypothetical protein
MLDMVISLVHVALTHAIPDQGTPPWPTLPRLIKRL